MKLRFVVTASGQTTEEFGLYADKHGDVIEAYEDEDAEGDLGWTVRKRDDLEVQSGE